MTLPIKKMALGCTPWLTEGKVAPQLNFIVSRIKAGIKFKSPKNAGLDQLQFFESIF